MTLSDVDIASEIEHGRLVENPDMQRVSGACYELRMGSVYYDLTEDGERFELAEDEYVLIKPGHRVVLITEEYLKIPINIIVKIISKGSLFSIGLAPVATYADPGFSGNLGIVTQNTSDKYLKIPRNEPIAKAEFTRLSSDSAKPYVGQHGFQAGVWPIKSQFQKAHSEVAGDRRVKSEIEEALALLPAPTRVVIKRIESTQLWIILSAFTAVIINISSLLLVNGDLISFYFGVIINILSSALIAVGTTVVGFIRRVK